MKVIVAGFSKTGTKTLNASLDRLGYNVYDYMEHFWEHGKYWEKILTVGGTTEDFKEMYKNVDAVVDVPAFAFWEEIHEAFPEAKIILTIRDENSWFQSFFGQMEQSNKIPFVLSLLSYVCPTARRLKNHIGLYAPPCFSTSKDFGWKFKPNKLVQVKKFREHNCYVIKNAPQNKLLIYNVKEGWAPLCEFLGKDIPEEPFPWRNKSGSEIVPMMNKHPFSKQVGKEILILCSCIVIIFSALIFYVLYS